MINVVDAMCGSGKTTFILNKIRDSGDDVKWLYITPYLSEVEERIPVELPNKRFRSPTSGKGKSKGVGLLELIRRNENIASTHALFKRFTKEIVTELLDRGYTLVIDEAINAVHQIGYTASDCEALVDGEFVTVDESHRGRLSWNESKYPNHKGVFSEIKGLCEMGMLYCMKKSILMFEYPPSLLEGLPEVWVLTYMFRGSDMRCWLDLNEIPYVMQDNHLLGLRSEQELKKLVKENLEIIETKSSRAFFKGQRRGCLSLRWFKDSSSTDKSKVKKMLRSAVVYHDVKGKDIFWTTFTAMQKHLQGAGYTLGPSVDRPCFLPYNIRATNNYADRSFCMYAISVFMRPDDKAYLKLHGVEVDEDAYALGEMIQFLFRGCIRNNQPMKVFILSRRMRRLLEEWLNE